MDKQAIAERLVRLRGKKSRETDRVGKRTEPTWQLSCVTGCNCKRNKDNYPIFHGCNERE